MLSRISRCRVAALPFVFVFVFALSAVALGADSGFWDRLEAQDQARGSFVQELLDEEGKLIERASGRYAILRPGFFRWEIDSPDRQELVVADGTLWHYDIDLGTVTVREFGPDAPFTALDLLASDRSGLIERFSVEALGGDRFRLVPRFPGASFSAVILAWSGDRVSAMDVRQRGGQTLSLVLKADTTKGPLSARDFTFEVPEGVDVQRGSGF